MKNSEKNENTTKSTEFWARVWKKWCSQKETSLKIEMYEPAEVNKLQESFYAEVKDLKGEDYEPVSKNHNESSPPLLLKKDKGYYS